jgi:hypothetical protein
MLVECIDLLERYRPSWQSVLSFEGTGSIHWFLSEAHAQVLFTTLKSSSQPRNIVAHAHPTELEAVAGDQWDLALRAGYVQCRASYTPIHDP